MASVTITFKDAVDEKGEAFVDVNGEFDPQIDAASITAAQQMVLDLIDMMNNSGAVVEGSYEYADGETVTF